MSCYSLLSETARRVSFTPLHKEPPNEDVLLLCGVGYAFHTVSARKWDGALWSGLWSVLYIIAGVMMLANPMSGVVTLTLLIAILFVIEGISKLLLAARLPRYLNRSMLIIDGFLGAGLGVLIWSAWPSDAAWVIGLLIGLRFLLAGSLLLMFAFAIKKQANAGDVGS